MEIPSTKIQNNFGKYLKFSQFEDVVVTKSGKKIAILKKYEEEEEDTFCVGEETEAYMYDNAKKVSYEEFIELTEDSEGRYEYIDGEIYLLASPSYDHQSIIMEISSVMYTYFKGKKCRPLTAPFDVTLIKKSKKNVVQPDIVVLCDTENINEKGRYHGIPALVVEVLSETTKKKDMLKKLNLYIKSGIKEYWIVNPFNKQIYIYVFEDEDIKDYNVYKGNEVLYSKAFEALKIPLEQIFNI